MDDLLGAKKSLLLSMDVLPRVRSQAAAIDHNAPLQTSADGERDGLKGSRAFDAHSHPLALHRKKDHRGSHFGDGSHRHHKHHRKHHHHHHHQEHHLLSKREASPDQTKVRVISLVLHNAVTRNATISVTVQPAVSEQSSTNQIRQSKTYDLEYGQSQQIRSLGLSLKDEYVVTDGSGEHFGERVFGNLAEKCYEQRVSL